MPANEQPKQDEPIKDQPAAAEMEKHTEEIKPEDAEKVAGGLVVIARN